MATADPPRELLSEYERAVCYYALPRVAHPLTYGIVAAYALCVLEALAAFLYGVVAQHVIWATAGGWALAGMVLFGLLVFFLRALMNDVRERRLLAEARTTPATHGESGLPDPFAGHVLLVRPRDTRDRLIALTENDNTIAYFVDGDVRAETWKVRNAQDEEECLIRGLGLRMGSGLARPYAVTRGGEEVARITRQATLSGPAYDLAQRLPAPGKYSIRDNAIQHEGRLVGRVYYLRGAFYLDIDRAHFNDAVLAYFVTVS